MEVGASLEGDRPCAPRRHAGYAAVRGAPIHRLQPCVPCVLPLLTTSHRCPTLTQMLAIAALMPLGIKLVYLREFAHLNPLIPTQYIRLCKQVYRAFLQNEGKASWT